MDMFRYTFKPQGSRNYLPKHHKRDHRVMALWNKDRNCWFHCAYMLEACPLALLLLREVGASSILRLRELK